MIPLNGLLLKRGVEPTAALSEASRSHASHFAWREDGLETFQPPTPTPTAPGDVVLTLFSRPSAPAPWEALISDVFSPPDFSPVHSQSLGAIVFLQVKDPTDGEGAFRWLGWAFGSGSRSIRRGAVEPRFGLLVVLNRIARADEGGIRQLEYRSFGAYRQRTGHTAGRDTPIDGFRIDPVMDLLSGIGGGQGPGSDAQLFGGRPLRLRTLVEGLGSLRALGQAAMEDFRDDSYAVGEFAFVEDFLPVEDEGELNALRIRLAELLSNDSDRVDAFFPDDLIGYEDPQTIHYVLLPGERAKKPSRVTLTLSNLATALGDAGEMGLDRSLRFLDPLGELAASATVLECLSADFTLKGTRYVVSDGDFYRVKPGFVDAIDESLARIPPSPISFPAYGSGDEAVWLQQTAADLGEQFVCMDGQLVKLQGETPFEAADLVHVSGALVHAKRKGRSSALSYLMVQARRSCQILSTVKEARVQLQELVKESGASKKTASTTIASLKRLAQTPPELDVVLVILGQRSSRGLFALPLLAKLELAETTRQIGQLGFKLSVEQVGLG